MAHLDALPTPADLASARPRREGLGYLFMLGAAVGFALMGAMVKLAASHVDIWEVTFFRSAGGLLVIAGLMWARRESFASPDPWLLAWRGAMGWVAMSCMFWGVKLIPLADAMLLNYTSPFFTAVLAAWLLGERLRWIGIFALLLASVGVVLVLDPTGAFLKPGALLALASGLFAGFAYVAVKRATGRNSPWTIVFYFSLVSSLLTLPWMAPVFRWPDLQGWLLLGAVVVSATVGQICMTYGYLHARASTAGIISLFTPLFAALLSSWWFHDPFGWMTAAGALLIVASGVLLARQEG